MVVEDGPLTLAEARAALAAEWDAAGPTTPDTVDRFYRTSEHLGDDLEAWHQTPERQSWTTMLVHVAREADVHRVVDIGCGAGHDLLALLDALPGVAVNGVEPNETLRDQLAFQFAEHRPYPAWSVSTSVEYAPIDQADLLVCVDVLEHVPDPASFLAKIATRAPLGCLLFEATATHNLGTPLHLHENQGWHPGNTLEACGWRVVDQTGRVRVWRRVAKAGVLAASLLLCAYRGVSTTSLSSIMATVNGEGNWRLRVRDNDADISRSRAIITTQWWRETADDVMLMIDDDIAFSTKDAAHVVELCRGGLDIVCGAYPVHNGEHLAIKSLNGAEVISFGPDEPPLEIRYASTGFMAVHRRVIDALVTTLPLCHANEPWAFYPLFPQPSIEVAPGEWERLSEDWGMCHIAREAGFRVWLDPSVRLRHSSRVPTSVANMGAVYDAIQRA